MATTSSETATPVSENLTPVSNKSIGQENYARLVRGVESIADYAIFMLSPEGIILTWNEGAKRIKGYEPCEIIGKHFSLFYTEDAKASKYPEMELEKAGSIGRVEEEGWRLRKDGSLFWANVIITAVFEPDEDGNKRLVGFTKVTRDLTERREAEEALRQSEERFRTLVEGVKDYAIFMLDPEGNIATWNEGAKRFKGYEAHEIIGKHFSSFYPQEARDRKHPEYELKVAVETGQFEEEGWRVRKDGSLFWANVVITALHDRTGKLLGFTKVTRDLTERKRMLDELAMSKSNVEAINKELESFSYSVSHDLRAPLRSIDGYTRLVLEDKADLLDEEAREYLERVCQNAQQMGKLIDDLLNLSRLTRHELSKSWVNLSEIAADVIAPLREEEPGREVTIKIQPDMMAYADYGLMRPVLQNLLGNAWKFTGGKEKGLIEFGTKLKGGETIFFIRDNGAGFNMKYAQKLFGAFQRLHDVTEFAGTGIGLATVQRIIHRHGGEVCAEGVEGEGATFYFTLG